MKKTHITISILLAIATLYAMWFVGFSQGKKVGIDAGKLELSNAIFNEVGQSGMLKVPAKDKDGQPAFAVLQLIKDEKGQAVIYPMQ